MRGRKGERGGALLLAVIISMSVVAISGAFISHSMIKSRTSFDSMMGLEALMTAESGAAAYVQSLNMKKNNPSFPAPAVNLTQKFVKDSTVYRLWAESVGANGVDDNGDGVIDDTIEQGFMRLWVDGHAGGMWDAAAGQYKGGSKRTLEVILAGQSGGVFWNAIFAGNNDGDPDFELTFENGNGNSRDIIKGNIYSGGNITHLGIAELLNDKGTAGATQVMYKDSLKANNSQKPPPTYVNGVQSDLDVAGMNYDARAAAAAANDITNPYYDPKMVNVTSALDGTDARYSVGLEANGFVANGDASQGRAGSAEAQINKNFATTNPAHLFRKNVTDSGRNRAHQDYKTPTPKDDYFLEDSSTNYGNGSPQGDWLGSDGGQMLDVHTTGNDKVYYIDGNLWLANSPTYTFQFQNKTGSDMRITIVVKGNIYLCDNLLYERDASGAIKGNDGVALIAINDDKFKSATPADIENPSHPAYNYGGADGLPYKKRVEAARDYNRTFGSGNVFFGDPAGGTTERFESFLYAQNNFYDNNLGANGTNMTNIYGNMTAGNHVEIQRQVGNFKPTHVTFDTRIRDGSLSLAGLPGNPNSADKDFKIASWRQVPSKPTKFGP